MTATCFLPDGPGALIYLNNGKTTAPVANILVYDAMERLIATNNYAY